MKRILLLLIVLINFNNLSAQSVIVDEILVMDNSSTWPFTWEIHVTDDNTIYTGNELNRIYKKEEGQEWEELSLPDDVLSDIRQIRTDAAGNLWIATDGSGIHSFIDNSWTSYTTANSNLSSDEVRHMEIDAAGIVYAGDRDGVNIFSNGSWSVLNSANSSLVENGITALDYNAVNDNVVMGDSEFLYLLKAGSIIGQLNLDDTFGWMTWVNTFYQDGDKTLIGTERGLYQIEDNNVTPLTDISGELAISDLAIDSEGNIWMGETFYGLHVYDGSTLHGIGSSDSIPSQIFDMEVIGDNVLLVGNRGARLTSARFDNMTSVSDIKLSNLRVLQNVSQDQVTVEKLDSNNENILCQLYNQNGQLIKQTLLISKITDISLRELSSGMYILRFLDENGTIAYHPKKVIKM